MAKIFYTSGEAAAELGVDVSTWSRWYKIVIDPNNRQRGRRAFITINHIELIRERMKNRKSTGGSGPRRNFSRKLA